MLNLLAHINRSSEINLIDLYHLFPDLIHQLISNTSFFADLLKSKKLTGIPKSLVQKFPSSSEINKLITVVGTIVKNGQVLLNNVKLTYTCVKCNSFCETKEICDQCGCTELIKSENFSSAMKCQKIRVQDISNPSCLSETLEIVLSDDFAGLFLPGERILVTGIVKLKINCTKMEMDMKPSIYLEALDIQREELDNLSDIDDSLFLEFNNFTHFEKRKFLIEGFKNEISGWNNVKLGMLLALAKGSMNGRRSTIHILLVGNPSTGKTFLMDGCLKMIFPSVYVNGLGTTDAGLTTCAVKQGKEWGLEAGALVLSDMGLCCIDELDAIKSQDCNGLLEAMEQQTLSIAKAGLVTTLNARTSVIASITAKFKYDILEDLISTNSLATPLLTRFDLIFGMFENKNEDTNIVNKIFARKTKPNDKQLKTWSNKIFKVYLQNLRKKELEIQLEEREILLNYYNKKRKLAGKTSEFFSIRLLEGLMRLVEAHAKLICKDVIDKDDVYSVIILYEYSLCTKRFINVNDEVFINENEFNKIKEELINKLK